MHFLLEIILKSSSLCQDDRLITQNILNRNSEKEYKIRPDFAKQETHLIKTKTEDKNNNNLNMLAIIPLLAEKEIK